MAQTPSPKLTLSKALTLGALAMSALSLAGCASDRPRQGRSLAATAPQPGMNLWHAGVGATASDGQTLPSLRLGYARSLGPRASIHGRLDTLLLIHDLELFARYRPLQALGVELGLSTLSVLVPGQATWMLGPRLGLWTSTQISALTLGAGLAAQLYMPCLTDAWANAQPPRPSCLAPTLKPQLVLGLPWWRRAALDVILGAQLGLQSDGPSYSALDLGLGISW